MKAKKFVAELRELVLDAYHDVRNMSDKELLQIVAQSVVLSSLIVKTYQADPRELSQINLEVRGTPITNKRSIDGALSHILHDNTNLESFPALDSTDFGDDDDVEEDEVELDESRQEDAAFASGFNENPHHVFVITKTGVVGRLDLRDLVEVLHSPDQMTTAEAKSLFPTALFVVSETGSFLKTPTGIGYAQQANVTQLHSYKSSAVDATPVWPQGCDGGTPIAFRNRKAKFSIVCKP